MTAMPAIVPAPRHRTPSSRPIVIEDDGDGIEIESVAVRASVEEAFLAFTSATGSNGYMPLADLLEVLEHKNPTVAWSEPRLTSMLGRCDRLILVSGGIVAWTGSLERSGLLRRMQTIVAVRKSKISPGSVLIQMRRGNDRYDRLTEHHIRDIANAHPDFRVIDGGIVRSGGFELQAVDVITGDELRIFKILQKTVFALTAEEINRKLGRRPTALSTIYPTLRESPVISDFDGGYRSILETPTQLGLKL